MSVTLIVTGFFYQLGMGIERTVLNINYYHNLNNEVQLSSHIHQGLQEVMPEMMLEGMHEEANEEISKEMVAETKERLSIIVQGFAQVFDEKWLEEQLLIVINDVLALIKGEQEEIAAVISISEGKEQLGPHLVQYLEKIPPEQLKQMEMQPEMVKYMVEDIFVEIPDEIVLGEVIEAQGMTQEANEAISKVQLFKSGFNFVPYILFALIIAGLYLIVGFPRVLTWFGTLAIISAVIFVTGVMLFRNVVVEQVTFHSIESPISTDALINTINYTVNNIYAIPLSTVIIGIILIFGGLLITKINDSKN